LPALLLVALVVPMAGSSAGPPTKLAAPVVNEVPAIVPDVLKRPVGRVESVPLTASMAPSTGYAAEIVPLLSLCASV